MSLGIHVPNIVMERRRERKSWGSQGTSEGCFPSPSQRSLQTCFPLCWPHYHGSPSCSRLASPCPPVLLHIGFSNSSPATPHASLSPLIKFLSRLAKRRVLESYWSYKFQSSVLVDCFFFGRNYLVIALDVWRVLERNVDIEFKYIHKKLENLINNP